MRALTFVFFLAVLTVSCGPAGEALKKCSVINCAGCCASDGRCMTGRDDTLCGGNGSACSNCTASSQVCEAMHSVCVAPGSVTGTDGGGGPGTGVDGGGTSTVTDGGSTSSMTDAGGDNASPDGGTHARVDAGSGPDAGPPFTCSGCLLTPDVCLDTPTSSNCGIGGSACHPCAPQQTCETGVCTPPKVVGLGAPCSIDTDCSAVRIESGYTAYCKHTTSAGNASYPGGYCTRRCLSSSQCPNAASGTASICSFSFGHFGETDNLCVLGCSSQSDCRAGYDCWNFGTAANPRGGCWLYPNGHFPDAVDAGAPNPGPAGGACTQHSQCGPSSDQYCVSAYPGGMCTGNCSKSLEDSWCGTGGLCLPYTVGQDSKGPRISWNCTQGCNPSGANTCRSGYVCYPYGGSYGTCFPDCRTSPNTCTGACNSTTGVCG